MLTGPTQSHISPSILVYEEKVGIRTGRPAKSASEAVPYITKYTTSTKMNLSNDSPETVSQAAKVHGDTTIDWVLIRGNFLRGVPREQKMLKAHLPRVVYHQVYNVH